MTSNVIPLPFKGDLIDYIRLAGREIEWLWRDGDAYIPVKPICDILGIDWSRQYRKVMALEEMSTIAPDAMVGGQKMPSVVAKMMTTGADGKQREMICISYMDFMLWLGNIHPSRMKEEVRGAFFRTRNELRLLIHNHYHGRLLGEIAEYSAAMQKLKMEAKYHRPLRGRVVDAVGYGWDFETLWRSGSTLRPKLVSVIKECLALGLIEEAPSGTPFAQFQPKVMANGSQMDMFGHG